MLHRLVLRAAFAAACALPLAARADAPTPEQANALEQQLHGWYAATFPGGPSLPVQITAAGDHYRLAVPLAGLFGAGVEGGGEATAALRPMPSGAWSLDDIQLPSPDHLTLTLPGRADHAREPVDVSFSLADQHAHAVFDPSYATGSSFAGTYGAFDLRLTSALDTQQQHFDGYTVNASLRPSAGGRMDLLEDVVGHGFAGTMHGQDGHSFAIRAARVQLASHLDSIDRTRVAPVLQAAMRLNGAMASALASPQSAARRGPDRAPPLDRAGLHDLILALRDVAMGGEVDETLDGVHATFDTVAVDLAHAAIGLGAEAPGGMLRAHLAVALDGLQSPDLPPQANAYMPHHIELRPVISGVSVAALTRMGLMATEPDFQRHRFGQELDALFSQGGISIGLETLAFDMGPARVSGSGTVLVRSATDQSGQAEITATGFDALMRQVQKDPALAQAFPVLALIRGLARQSGDRLVWTIVLQNDRLLVNGTDLSAMLGARPRRH